MNKAEIEFERDRKEYRKRMEERIGGEMSTTLKFVPQCSNCKFNDPPDCEKFKPKPDKYKYNQEECPEKEIETLRGDE